MRECEYVFFTADGTNIEYDVVGEGEKLLLIHDFQGADEEIVTLRDLLAQWNTVYCPVRRGWSCSGSKGREYSMEMECSDLIEMMKKFEIENIFGMMHGAVIAMHIALRYPVKKMVLQSPYLASLRKLRWLPKMRSCIRKEDYFGAFAVYIRGTSLLCACIPHIFVKAFLKFILPRARTDADLVNEMVTENFKPERLLGSERMLTQLAEELTAASEAEPELHRLSSLNTETLFLCDCNDEMYIHASVDQLLRQIPNSRKEITRLMPDTPRRTKKIIETCDVIETIKEFLT